MWSEIETRYERVGYTSVVCRDVGGLDWVMVTVMVMVLVVVVVADLDLYLERSVVWSLQFCRA